MLLMHESRQPPAPGICHPPLRHAVPAARARSFGDFITVERRITRTNAPYRLLDARGKCLTTKKDEVDAVLDHFSIDASNPLTIITQDMARQFLSGG